MTVRNLFHQESVVYIVESRALQWFGNVRRKDERKPTLIMETCPDGGRGRERPRLECFDYTEKLGGGKTLLDVKCIASIGSG